MRDAMVSLGPHVVERVPLSHFSRFKRSDLDAAWNLIGPSVEMNIDRAPIWKVITAAYLEGLLHGAELGSHPCDLPKIGD